MTDSTSENEEDKKASASEAAEKKATEQAEKQAEKTEEQATKKARSSFKVLMSSIGDFFRSRLSILDNAQPEKTIEGIERDIDFKGFNLWILIPAILIASVGLNANSTAVVVGAMLISPLMGPIMGLGLSVGINDFTMLKRSLRNLGIAVGVSIITSTIFFAIIPIDDASSELLARTRPDIRDVFIAFFGGFAGILAGSRKEKSNVIPGVAIATALMPPLCTAGYGLATMQFSFFLGATYLFLINTFFIALATVLVVRYLRFPVRSFMDKGTENRAKRLLALSVIVMIVPASIIFFNVVRDTIYKRKVSQFITKNIHYGEATIVKQEVIRTDSINYIDLVIFGDVVPKEAIANWQRLLNETVEETKLRIFQGTDNEGMPQVEKLVDMFTNSQTEMATKDEKIRFLEAQVDDYKSRELPQQLLEEIKINYPEVMAIKIGRMQFQDFRTKELKTVPDVVLFWEESVADEIRAEKTIQIKKWLNTRLADSVEVSSTLIPQLPNDTIAE